jgi:hypothetical protein
MLGAIVAACAFLFYGRIQAVRFNVTAALLGIAAAFGMLYVFPVYLFRHVGRRIVVGADRLQIINFSGAVVTQIPYRNIGRMETFGWLFPILGIDVTNKDRDTFWGFGDRGKSRGYDIAICDVYTQSLEGIRGMITNAYGLWSEAQACSPTSSGPLPWMGSLASPSTPGAPSRVPPRFPSYQPENGGSGLGSESTGAAFQAVEHQARRPGELARAWAEAHTSSPAPDEITAGPHANSMQYDQGGDELGPVVLRVQSAEATTNYTLLTYGCAITSMIWFFAILFMRPDAGDLAAVLKFAAYLAAPLILMLGCFYKLLSPLFLHEHGIRVRGLLGARKLYYRDLSDVGVHPVLVTKSVNFVPVSRRTILKLQFVPHDGTGLKPIEYTARFDQLGQLTALIRAKLPMRHFTAE